jgi:hypothetical protein
MRVRKPVAIAILVLASAAVFVVTPARRALGDEVQSVASVLVTNFPKVWNVTGKIEVDGPISHARYVPLREVVVPPVSPKDTIRLVQGGTIDTDGFTAMVVGLSGQIKGEVYRSGTVGVFVLPDEELVVRAFEEKGLMQFMTELNASGVSAASPYFASSQTRIQIGFPRYRTYFYNSSDKSVSVNLFAYLTN